MAFTSIIVLKIVERIVILRKYILFFSLTSLSYLGFGQDSSAFFVLTQADMLTNNITNLEEALRIPSLYQYFEEGDQETRSGILRLNEIAIFKDGLPLMMDNNVGYDLRSIATFDIDRIEVHFSPHTSLVKNIAGVVIHLYSRSIADQPFSANAYAINSSTSDFHIGTTISLSNRRHIGQVSLNRSFLSPIYADIEDRGTVVSGSERYDLNLRYKFNILRTVKLTVGSDNSRLRTQQKGNVFLGTTRVRDIEQRINRNNLYSSLETELSKNHSVVITGLINRYSNRPSIIDKDLNKGIQEEQQNEQQSSVRGYDQGFLSVLLTSKNKAFNYSLGLEFNNVKDNQFEEINAITPAYSDYSALGLFQYEFRKTFLLEGGMKVLTNSLTNSYFLPSFKITLAPKNNLQLLGSYQQSIAYPMFDNIFYPAELSGGTKNNLTLRPVDLSSTNVRVLINRKNITFESGMMLLNRRNNHRVSSSISAVNDGSSRSTMTYLRASYNNSWIDWRPSVILHGINTTRDTNALTFFYPEANSYLQLVVPNSKFKFGWTYRFIGERNYQTFEQGELRLLEEERLRTSSMSVSRSFLDESMMISFGISNFGSSTEMNRNEYEFIDIVPVLVNSEKLTVNKERSFFFNIRLNIK